MSHGPATQSSGRVITFYSYKGGTGRSMALANIAYLLARGIKGYGGQLAPSNQKVLAIDWDLEAPGLHRYFEPFLLDASEDNRNRYNREYPGVIDLFAELEEALQDRVSRGPDEDAKLIFSVLDDLDVEGRFSITTSVQNLSFMKAGRFNGDYPSRVSNFHWNLLYERMPVLIPTLVRYLSERFTYVLIDSRTGITDTSGICTMLMPELLVLVFTPNLQSLDGAIGLIREATSYRRQSADLRPLVIFPLPSRIEAAKPELLEYWRKGSEEVAFRGFQAQFESAFKDSYYLERCDLTDYFDEVQIQHVPDYAYGEQIAVALEETDSRLSLRRSYESFARRLIGLSGPWIDPSAAAAEAQIMELCQLGAKELDKNNTQRAQRHFASALDIYLRSENVSIPELADGLRQLGSQYLAEGELGQAETVLREAVEVAERDFGSNGLRTADCLERLGDALTAAGKAQEALDLIERVLNVKKRALSNRHPSIADLDDKLGDLLVSMGRLEESRVYFDQSLVVRREIFGPDSPALTASLERLAETATAMGNLREAEEYLNQALELSGREDWATKARILGRLGWLNLRKRNLSSAEQYFQEAIDGLGPASEDPATANIFDGSAQVAIGYGDYDKARSYYERAQLVRETVLGPSHPDALRGVVNLGDLAAVQGMWERANTYYRRALSLLEKTASEIHPLAGEIYLKLGEVAQGRRNYSEAERFYQHAIGIHERLGDQAGISSGYHQLGTLAQARGDYDSAEVLYRRSLEIDERLGDQAGMSSGYRHLGALAQARGDYRSTAIRDARWRVFVSHTSELREFPKGRSYVAAVEEAISATGHTIVDMADFSTADRPAAELCAERVRGCQVYVGVLGTRYGSPVRDMPGVSYTELEFDVATEAGLDRLMFLLDTEAADVGIPLSALIDQEFGARQEVFRRRVQDSGLVIQTFTDPATLAQLVERSLRELAETGQRRDNEHRRGQVSPVVVAGEIPQAPLGFQPRADLLAALDAPGSQVVVVRAMTGMRGVGKTHLAAAYARAKLAEGWRLVAWVNAEDPSGVLAGLAEVATALGVATSAGNAVTAGQAVRHRLEADGERCLLVFDNATNPEVLQPFIPATGAARIIITSNQQSMAYLGASVPVDVFSEQEALAFLASRTGQADATGARALAAELGFLPLALAQAAAVIAGQHLTYGSYLDRLRRLPAGDLMAAVGVGHYPRGVAAAVLLSLDAVRASDDTGVCGAVMDLLAVLSAAGVRRSLIYAAGREGLPGREGSLPGVAPEVADRALARLAGASLLTFSVDGSIVSAHRLVMRVIQESLAASSSLTAVCQVAARLLKGLAESLSESWHEDRAAVRDLVEQIMALYDASATYGSGSDLDRRMIQLRSWALRFLIHLGDSPAQAIVIGDQLLADQEAVLGPEDPSTLASRSDLASAYLAAGRTDEAISLNEQVLAVLERVLGPEDPSTLASRSDLASAYRAAGRTTESSV